jgi:glutamate-ammonia-ligase adenylyltransferase
MAAEFGLIPVDLAETVRNAYRDYRRLQHGLRLNGTKARVEPASVSERVVAVRELWYIVFETTKGNP